MNMIYFFWDYCDINKEFNYFVNNGKSFDCFRGYSKIFVRNKELLNSANIKKFSNDK